MIGAVKRVVAVLAVAIAGSQAGHLLAYELRFGAAAQQLQSSGAHAYFPLVARTFLGAAAMALIAALLLIGLARLATGRKIEEQSAPSFFRLLAGLYTLQLVLFVGQEVLEGSPAGELFFWGMVGQLPVAIAGALALRWLLARLAPALGALTLRLESALQLLPLNTALLLWPAPVAVLGTTDRAAGPITRRGPPTSS